jgi:parallel beta-helix repeat protein
MKNGFLALVAKNRGNKLKWKIASATLTGIALLFAFQGFSRAADDDRNATAITNCTDPTMINITQAGRYFLANDLVQCNPGISITVSDVKLELRGHTIQGASGITSGLISVNGGAAVLSNIEIAGPGTVTSGILGSYGIDFENVHRSRVYNLVIVANGTDGIVVNTTIPTNASTASTDQEFHDNEFYDNVIAGNNNNGITVNGGTNNEFRDNAIAGNGFDGIVVNGGNENRFIHNNLSGNGSDGLHLLNANNNIARRNTADSNVLGNGIDVLGSGNTIDQNTALGNVLSFDLVDENNQTEPNSNCLNLWTNNSFNTNSPSPGSCFP